MAMLRLKIREIRGGPVAVTGLLEPADDALQGLPFSFRGPVEVSGQVQETEEGDFLWRGHLRAALDGECRRCLAEVTVNVDDDVDVLFSSDPELAEDPSVYPLDPKADVLDLTTAVREELVLRVTGFPLCRPDCKGLCAGCGADLNAGPCACSTVGSTS